MTVRNETATAASDRLWWPKAFVEETMPAGRASPSAWLSRLDDGAHRVGDADDHEEWTFLVTEGQIVEFTFRDHSQCKPFEIAADGEISFPEGKPTGNHFWLENEWEFCGDTLSELIAIMAEFGVKEGSRNIRSYTWGNIEQPHRFTAQDGPPRFVPVEGNV